MSEEEARDWASVDLFSIPRPALDLADASFEGGEAAFEGREGAFHRRQLFHDDVEAAVDEHPVLFEGVEAWGWVGVVGHAWARVVPLEGLSLAGRAGAGTVCLRPMKMSMHIVATVAGVAIAGAVVATPAHAAGEAFSMAAAISLASEPPPATAATTSDTTSAARVDLSLASPAPFASAGSHWGSFGLGITPSFAGDSVGFNGTFSYSYFLIDGVEMAGELGAWYYAQDGDDAFGVNPNAVLRWHFWRSDDLKTTVYADTGIGFMVSNDKIPSDGTSFNFTPRMGVGFTRQLTDSGWRLQGGVRWNHVSNARITGDSNNPSRDGPLLYVNFIFPF